MLAKACRVLQSYVYCPPLCCRTSVTLADQLDTWSIIASQRGDMCCVYEVCWKACARCVRQAPPRLRVAAVLWGGVGFTNC